MLAECMLSPGRQPEPDHQVTNAAVSSQALACTAVQKRKPVWSLVYDVQGNADSNTELKN